LDSQNSHPCKEAEITVQTFYRWGKQFGGLKLDQANDSRSGEGEQRIKAAGGGAVSGKAGSEEL
jgi:hypothetical protein